MMQVTERHGYKMMKKKFVTVLMAVSLIIGCTGCTMDYMPDLSKEQMQEIGEYVAITMMKYDANNRSRLVEIEMSELETSPVQTPAPTEAPKEPEGMGSVADTPVIDVAGGETEPAVESMEEVLALPEGLKLAVIGYDVCESYPEGDENPYFALYAVEGKQLLAVKLQLENSTGVDLAIDMLSLDETFTVKVNEEYTRRALTTMLENDLTTYIGVIPAGKSVEAVLIIEVEDALAGNISIIELKVENAEKEYTINVL